MNILDATHSDKKTVESVKQWRHKQCVETNAREEPGE